MPSMSREVAGRKSEGSTASGAQGVHSFYNQLQRPFVFTDRSPNSYKITGGDSGCDLIHIIPHHAL